MDVKEAKFQLEMAKRNLANCEAHLQRAIDDWSRAQTSRVDNKLYYRFRRTMGNDYMQQFRDAKDAARKEWDGANEELNKAAADYNKAVEDSH